MLEDQGVDLQLLYGRDVHNAKKDEANLSWGTVVPQSEFSILGRRFLYQHLPESVYRSRLIILMQENRILSNFTTAYHARRKGVRVALWGHGINLQDNSESLANRWKRFYSTWADWWFAYTPRVAQLVSNLPFPRERVTVVQNAIDTRKLKKALSLVTGSQKLSLRRELNLGSGPVGIYCGGMYPEKRLPFLVEACKLIRQTIPDFEVILIGAGQDEGIVRDFAATHPWAHYLGPKFGLDRVPYFAISDLFLMPGLVGLAVLDSFALGTPMVTTDYPFHSPEIEYLEDGFNGLISQNSIESYAQKVIDTLQSATLLPTLRANAATSADLYTVEAMVGNFGNGILAAMEAPLAH
jgi:glycosyltransferase involved in cell wall biosynthesis